MTVGGPTSITAQVSIDPLTPVGPRSVTLVTPLAGGNEEVVSEINGFTVSPGIAAIATVGSSTDQEAHQFAIQQGQILTFMLTGSATHWLQGETTVSMGSDVAVSQLSVIDPTHISLQIAVSYTATLGFRAVTATTSGEIASSFSDAVNVTAAQATMLNITPTTGAQGTTVTIQVNGIGTHWTSTASNPANNTTASFGNNDGLNITAINVISATQMNLTLQILGTAYPSPALYSLTVTTTGVTGPPQSTEQLTLSNVFAVSPGAAIITNVTPPSGNQGTTAQIAVTGQLTNFLTGTTTAAFSTGGCLPANSAGINVTNVTASGPASATLSIAITPTAATGYQTLCMYTLGETVSYSNAFQVLPGNPTLNEVAPVTGEQGQTLTGVEITGQFTSWNSTTVATFGQGITVQNLQVTSPTTATANLVIDPLANIGGRQTTMTTGSQIVSGNFFSVVAGPGEITGISPAMANQGQEILMTVTGQNTHWSQGLTQFSISGAGYDITVNGVQIASATSAIVDLTVSGTAALGTRTVSMSTGGENVSLQAGFLVTGGIPAIISVSPNSGRLGDVADNILITGVFTNWTPLSAVDFGDPCITVAPIGSANGSTWDDSFNITAVVSIGNTSACTASLGVHTVTVRTTTAGVTSAQTGQFIVYNSAGTNGGPGQPPEAYISYEYPSVALVGQTLMVSLTAQGTNWLPDQTTAAFGAGIQLNSFQVTGLTSAVANITIASGATVGSRTVSITTGTQTLTTSFYVTVGQPAISLVDPSSAIQGETRLIDLVGQYTTWTATGSNPTQFTVCAGVTITPGSVQIFGPTAARMQIVVSALAPAGSCAIGAITGAESVSSYLNITPGSEVVTSVSPNTAIQGSTGFVVNVVGFDTLWTNQTVFSFGSGVTVTAATVTDNTDATLTLSLDPYASPGVRTLSAATSGQIAYLNNAFVVQPGTPILLSSAPGSAAQQSNFDIGILGQYTSFNSGTTVVFPSGGVSNVAVNVTSAQSITVTGVVNATAYPGCGNIVVTTPGQSPSVLTLSGAFCIAPGPAAITSLTPDSLGQGQTGNIQIAGANTNFLQGTTVGTFGPGISVNTLTINSPLSATANITVAANATPEINTVTLTTAGETATDPSSFTIFAATSVITTASPVTGAQAQTNITVNVTGAFTHFVNGNTTASFGAGITVNSVTVSDSMHAAVSLSIQPTALVGQRDIQIITNLTGGAQEVAVKSGAFTITAGPAAISAVTPVTPAAVHQGDNGDVVTITGSATHFTAATPTLSFCAGITVVAQVVNSDTQITATISVPTTAPLGACGVTVSTLGEIASGSNLFNIMAGVPAITGLTPNSAHQGDGQSAAIAVGIAGRYTHFTSGGVSVSFGSGITVSGTPAVSSDTALSVNIQVDPAATLAGRTVTVTDATDGTITLVNGFSVAAGVPAITSVTPATGAQGSTQTLTITGSFTSWTVSSVVSLSGGGDLTVGSPAVVTNLSNGYQQTIQVPVTVTTGAAATARTVTVTTGGQQLSFANAFTVLPGMPNITQISPNIGVPNSTVTVTITGQFTNWVNGTTVANFGPGVSVNGGGSGATGTLTINNAYTATATLTVDANATLGSRNVTVTTGTQILTVTNGFTVQADTTTPPSVTYVSPTRGAQNVPINSRITVVFSEPMNPASFAGNTILSGPGGVYTDVCGFGQSVVPVSTSLDASGRILTVTPAAQLSVGSGYALSLNFNCNAQYISDQSGNVLPALYSPFTTGFAPDTSGPTFTEASVANGASGLPINANIALGFNKPLNAATVATGLSIMQGSNPVPGTWSYSSDFTQAMFYPASNLTPSAGYTVAYSAALTDAVGNPLTNPGTLTFTTAATTDTSLPQILSYTPQNGITTGTNPFIRFAYNKPINPLTVTPATFYLYTYVSSQGDVVVNGTTVTVSPDNTTFTLNLSSPLQAGMQYYVTSSCVYDWAGNGCGYGYTNFITGTGVDSTAPVVTSVSPPPSFTCGSNPCAPVNSNVEFQFSKSMDPTSLNPVMTVLSGPTYNPADAWSPAATFETGFTNHTNPNGVWSYGYSSGPTGLVTLFDQATQGAYNGPNAQFWLSSTVNNGGSPSVEYNNGPAYNNGNIDFLANQVVLVAGVGGQYADLIFTAPSSGTYSITSNFRGDQYGIGTSVGVVANGSVLFSSSVTADAQNVPFSTQVSLTAGSTVAFYAGPGSGNQNTGLSVIITNQSAGGSPSSGPIPGTFSFSNSSGSLLTFTPSTTLLPSSTYTISLSGGLQDVDGNIVAPFTSTFTTGSSALPDGTQGTITGTPSNGGTNVPVNSTVVLQLSKPVDWATVNSSSFYVFDSSAGVEVPGTIAHSADYQTLTFTPTSQYQPNHQICYSGGYQQSLYDLTGSPFAYLYYDCFTTGSTADTTPPTVTSVSPLNSATGIGPRNPVIVTLSKSLNPGAISGNVALYNGSTLLTQSYTPSSDYTTFTFNTGQLPYSTTLTVIVSPNVTDLAGNRLASEFSSTFTTGPQPTTSQPQINAMRPGSA